VAVSQFHFQIAQLAQAGRLPLKFPPAAQINRDLLCESECGAIDPSLQYCCEVASLQIIIKEFKSQQKLSQQGNTGVGLLSFDTQRCGALTKLFREYRMIDVDADPDNDV